jgi:glucan 1,3-beta-glucosidase
MADLEIEGGLYGINIGNQQFTIRNVKISKAQIGISQIWNWGFLYSGISISDCGTAFSMISGYKDNNLQIGSVVFIDSEITNCPIFMDSTWWDDTKPTGAGQLILENVKLNNVPVGVTGYGIVHLPGTTGAMTIGSWGQGNKYSPDGPEKFRGNIDTATRPQSLLDRGRYYSKSKPTYADLSVDRFISARDSGCKGNGRDDDTGAVQSAITRSAKEGKVVYFEHGMTVKTNLVI